MADNPDDVDPVLTSLRNILRHLETKERLSNNRRKQLRIVAAARRDRIFSAPELIDTDEDDDVGHVSPCSTRSWRTFNTGSPPSSQFSKCTMNGDLKPAPSRDGPCVRSGSSLKRNHLVHERPKRLNGLSLSADRTPIREESNGDVEKCGLSQSVDASSTTRGTSVSALVQSFDRRLLQNGDSRRPVSPKRKQAPPPPPLPKSSPPSPRQVCRSEVVSPDRQGWLLDQLKGEKVWCVLADMLFCVFESDSSEKSRDVIFLPGCKVRSLVYHSPKTQDGGENNKTVTGVHKFQFYVENISIRRRYLFGTKCRTELDEWVDLLTRACDIIALENCQGQGRDSDGWDSCEDSVFQMTSERYCPSSRSSTRMSRMSKSLKDNELADAKSGSIVDFRRRLRKESDDSKVAPVKGLHNIDSPKQPKKSKSFIKLRSFGSLDSLLRRKRSSSAERAEHSDSSSVDDGKCNSGKTKESRNTSQQKGSSKQSFLSRSWDSGKSSNGLGSSIRRRASDLKDKMFGGGKSSTVSRSPGLRLKDLTDLRINGSLQYKFMMKWIKVWCVVSRGCFYGFKTQNGEETPLIAVVLTQSTVSYVTEPEKRNRKLYVFKLSQPHCKSIYLCAQEEGELSRWLQTLQMEACRVQADDNLAMESTSDTNYSVDSALSVMSMASSHTDSMDAYHHSSLNSTSNSTENYIPGVYDPIGSDGTCGVDSAESADEWDASSQGSSNELMYPGFSDLTPKHDPSVSYLWGKDKGYLLQVIRAKLRKARRSQDDTDAELFDRELPRSDQSGSLLMIGDDTVAQRNRKSVLETKTTRSLSFGDSKSAPVTPELDSRGGRTRPRPLAVRKLPAQDLLSPTISGYSERKGFNGLWTRYWYLIKDGYLYCYLSPSDQVTVDITHLHGYQVTSLVDHFRGKRFVIHLSHENYVPIFMSFDSRDDMEAWSAAMEEASKLPKPPDTSLSGQEDCKREEPNGESKLTIKQRLLAEVLRQKEELEKKQAARRQATRHEAANGYGPHTSHSQMPENRHISTITRLKQRRLSTQIKMEAIQRQLGDGPKNGHKKSLFKLSKKKSQEEKNPQLMEQLKELSTTLHEIDINLNHEGVVTSNNVKSSKLGFHNVPVDGDVLKKGDSFETEEQAVQRSNSLKASVQRLAHRTFAKAGWRKNTKKSHSLHFEDYQPDEHELSQSQEMIDLTSHSADIMSSISFSSSTELTSMASSSDISGHAPDPDSPLSGRSTPASLCSPRSPSSPASPRVSISPKRPHMFTNGPQMIPNTNGGQVVTSGSKASPRDRGLSAARAEMMTRSYSAGPSLSNSFEGESCSPRREVNPTIMAEIDAFEELTKQVLSQRAALASH